MLISRKGDHRSSQILKEATRNSSRIIDLKIWSSFFVHQPKQLLIFWCRLWNVFSVIYYFLFVLCWSFVLWWFFFLYFFSDTISFRLKKKELSAQLNVSNILYAYLSKHHHFIDAYLPYENIECNFFSWCLESILKLLITYSVVCLGFFFFLLYSPSFVFKKENNFLSILHYLYIFLISIFVKRVGQKIKSQKVHSENSVSENSISENLVKYIWSYKIQYPKI